MNAKFVGSKIAEARKNKGVSQAQLAQQLFISPQAVGKWERGESVPDILAITRLAELLGVDLNYFSGGTTTDIGSTDTIQSPLPADEPPTAAALSTPDTLTNFSGSNLAGIDFVGTHAPARKFNGSALQAANFAAANLTGSTFSGSDVRNASFNGANLTDCTFSASDMSATTFEEANLTNAKFTAVTLNGALFDHVAMVGTTFDKCDLTTTGFTNCTFNGVHFRNADLRNMCFDGQTFTNVHFDRTALNNATFRGATLQNVSFRPGFAITNKYYRALATINFDGARMDKLTYAALKGIGAEMAGVIVV